MFGADSLKKPDLMTENDVQIDGQMFKINCSKLHYLI